MHIPPPMTSSAEPDLFGGLPLPAKPLQVTDKDESKSRQAFKTISEAADMLSLPQHVLRFWETKFSRLKPLKLKGGRRYYRPQDIETLLTIKHLLYKQGYTIRGARKAIAAKARPEQTKEQKSMKEGAMRQKKPAPDMQDSPLFQASAKMEQAEKKKALAAIRDELLALRTAAAELSERENA